MIYFGKRRSGKGANQKKKENWFNWLCFRFLHCTNDSTIWRPSISGNLVEVKKENKEKKMIKCEHTCSNFLLSHPWYVLSSWKSHEIRHFCLVCQHGNSWKAELLSSFFSLQFSSSRSVTFQLSFSQLLHPSLKNSNICFSTRKKNYNRQTKCRLEHLKIDPDVFHN